MSPASITSRTADSRETAMQHILVVEDEEHLAVGITFNLKRAGYRVTTVGEGPAALKVVQQEPDGVDLVVLDIMLPGMSGYAVCEAIRAAGHKMPILILSSRTLSEDRIRGFEVGANQYMMKPFDLDEFLSRIRNLLQHAPAPPVMTPRSTKSVKDTYTFGDAQINFQTFEVIVRGEASRLTAQELRLLKYFVEHEGRVIPRHELLEQVWDQPGHLPTRAPDQFIRRLRKIFESDPAEPRHFLTIRDAGYRFVAEPESEQAAAEESKEA